MSFIEGMGDAGDAEIHAEPVIDTEVDDRTAAGAAEAHATYLREARANLEHAKNKLATAERDLADAQANLAAVEAEIATLEEGEN